MINKKLLCLIPAIILLLAIHTDAQSQQYEAYTDTTFNNLFDRSGGGFTGGDGTYSIALPDGRSVWIFGDTFLGTVNPDGTRKKMDPMYVRNSFVVQHETEMKTLYTGTPDDYQSLVIPPDVTASAGEITELDVWYWPGDGFVDGDLLKVFWSKFRQTGGDMWDFEWIGTAITTFTLPDLKLTEITELPAEKMNGYHIGHAVLVDDSYTYMYGLKDGKPYTARAFNKQIEAEWKYYSNGEWIDKPKNLTPVLDVSGSEQFSVFELNGNYYLVTQHGGFSNEIWAYKSEKPYKWNADKGKKIYTIDMPFDNPNLFSYNALAHPQFINENNEILISYNINTHLLQDHFDNALIYRPRFIRVPVENLD